MLNISVIDNLAGFYALRDVWNELLKKSESNNIFLRWEWLYNWWRIYGDSPNKLFILTLKEGEQHLGIAPLYKTKYLSFFTKIKFLGSNEVCSDYLDFLLMKNREKELIHAIFTFVKKEFLCWDVLDFSDICVDSKNIPYIMEFFHQNKILSDRRYTACPYIILSKSWQSIYDSYSSSLKNTIRQKDHKFKKLYNSAFIEVSQDNNQDNNLNGYFSEFLRLNKIRFEKKKIKSPFLDKRFLTFHQKVFNELYKEGIAKLYFLKLDSKFIAGIYLFDYKQKYYYYQSGFDPAWSKLSPGTLLFHYCIKNAHKKNIVEFDFLRGNEKYKNNWTKNKRFIAKLNIYNNTAKGLFLSFIETNKNRIIRNLSLNH